MDPSSYQYESQYQQSSNKKKKMFVLVAVIVVVFFVVVGMLLSGSPKKPATSTNGTTITTGDTTVTLRYNVPNPDNAVVKLNGKTANPATSSGNSQTFIVKPNDYTLSVTNQGYSSFTTQFTINKGQTDIIVVHVSLLATPNINITSASQLSIPSANPSSTTITNVAYFDNKTWAVVNINSGGNLGVVVAQYSIPTGTWSTELGPGTSFDPSSVQAFPQDVQTYLETNNYVNSEADNE